MKKPLLVLILAAPLALAQKKQLQPGEWETTVKMEMEGSTVALPPMVSRRCVSDAEIKKPEELFRPKNPHANDNCQMQDVKQEGNKVTWVIDCKGKGHGSGTVTFDPGKYEGVTQMEMLDRKGERRRMKSTISGRRLGDCQPGQH